MSKKPSIKEIRNLETDLCKMPFSAFTDISENAELQIRTAIYTLQWVITGNAHMQFAEVLIALEKWKEYVND